MANFKMRNCPMKITLTGSNTVDEVQLPKLQRGFLLAIKVLTSGTVKINTEKNSVSDSPDYTSADTTPLLISPRKDKIWIASDSATDVSITEI